MKYILSVLLLSLLPAAHAQLGINAPLGLTPRQDLEIYTRNGFLVQQKFTLTTADPNASINTLSCVTPPPDLTASAGILKDPGGDSNYPASLTCNQTIRPTGSTQGFEVVFEDLDTEAGQDLIVISDVIGNTLTFSGATLPVPFFLVGYAFRVRFQTNSNGTVGRGFRLRWRAVTLDASTPTPNTAFGNALQFDVNKAALLGGYLSMGALQQAGQYSTALGDYNTASGSSSSALGHGNSASGGASSALGYQNTASGNYSSALGFFNTASGYSSSALGYQNTASGNPSSALGYQNTASGNYSSALGGFNNTASGLSSTALGYYNTASGDNSSALGNLMSTGGQKGSFAIGDSDPLNQGTTTISVADQLVARFRNGYYLLTSGNTSASRTGVVIGAGQNAWGSISDSTRKERLLPIEQTDLLRKIGTMKLSTWNYKGQREIRHYGPMAQDFFAAFGHDGLGQVGCDTLIYSHDFAGVTFAGVQALIQENQQLKAKLSQMESQANRNTARLDALESVLLNRRGRTTFRKHP